MTVLGFCLAAWGGFACADRDIGAGTGTDCREGTLGCVCDDHLGCNDPYVCIGDLCVEAEIPSGDDDSESDATLSPDDDDDVSPTLDTGTDDDTSMSTDDHTSGNDSTSDETCTDRKKNGDETDVDCGGRVCSACIDGLKCKVDSDCESSICESGICVAEKKECIDDADCDDSNPCTKNICDTGTCKDSPANEGEPCNDADPCTAQDRCGAGECSGMDTRVLTETFSSPTTSWTFEKEDDNDSFWEIGPAKASACDDASGQENSGEDPAKDHTGDPASGLAGVVIGGCHESRDDNRWDCLWSADVDVSFFDEKIVLSFWRHLHTGNFGDGDEGVLNRIAYRIDGGEPKVIEEGWPDGVNDIVWSRLLYQGEWSAESIAFGICYQRRDASSNFAGWSVDDVRVRQAGCDMEK